MKNLTLLLLLLFEIQLFGQTYKDKVSFTSDLWVIEYAEEAVRSPENPSELTWVQRRIARRKNVIYLDISDKGTLIGIKSPVALKLSSEGLNNNGYIGEKKYSNNNMHIQSYARDEMGNVWQISVGKDRLTEDMKDDPTNKGRIYMSIHDTNGIQSGWYFVIQTLGKQR
jgi:hypothetical protein